MLRYNGHVFDGAPVCSCCTTDAKVVIDPTGTKPLSNRWNADFRRRVNQLRVTTQLMIYKQDILGLKPGAAMQIMSPGVQNLSTRQEMFQRWINQAMKTIVADNDAMWMYPYIQRAYNDGATYGNSEVEDGPYIVPNASHRVDGLFALAKMELQGILDATSQQATRVANLGIATNTKPMIIVRGVCEVFERTLFNRVVAMVSLITVKSFGDGTLDVYEKAGVEEVGLIPEARNAATQQKAKDGAQIKDAPRKGFGSRVSRKKTPSASTIGRVRKQELNVAKALGEKVNVRTAGDDDVCPICEGIAEDGPYKLDTARGLIPAHPHCRCTFTPVKDRRFKVDAALQ
jgi:hypothetical protein